MREYILKIFDWSNHQYTLEEYNQKINDNNYGILCKGKQELIEKSNGIFQNKQIGKGKSLLLSNIEYCAIRIK